VREFTNLLIYLLAKFDTFYVVLINHLYTHVCNIYYVHIRSKRTYSVYKSTRCGGNIDALVSNNVDATNKSDRQTNRHRPIMVSQEIHDQMVPLRSVQFPFLLLESIQSLSHGRGTCATLR